MKYAGLLILSFFCILKANIKLTIRQNYYTNEDSAEVLIDIKKDVKNLKAELLLNDTVLLDDFEVHHGLNRISLPIKQLPIQNHSVAIKIPQLKYNEQVILIKLLHKKNTVKIDKKSGSLIVNDRYLFPFGFYCYSPVQKQIVELEVVKGFNLMSPYQAIDRKTRKDREAYMDRCAELGMKVNYNLCRVAGGGGVGSNGRHEFDVESEKLLIEEINYFKDHPALLAWYIADEPVGQHIPVSLVEKIYKIIKNHDPYHPVSVVFMTPSKALEYKDALDIVMTDPYPVPGGDITHISTIVKTLQSDFYLEKPIWLVPQAFGGNETWKREPDWREIRMMTYQGIINDAKGIQYFIRHGYNSFPKSTAAWGEAAKISLEVRELSQFLLDYDEKIDVECENENIDISAWRKNNKILIGAINKSIKPQYLNFIIENTDHKMADVVFEFRRVTKSKGSIEEQIDGYGTRFHLVSHKKEPDFSSNTFINPGFEKNRNAAVPEGCYAKVNGDLGATYFLDKQEVFEGKNSINIITPENSSISLGFFSSRLKKGNSYQVSIMAKSDKDYIVPNKSLFFNIKSFFVKDNFPVEISIGRLGNQEFTPTNQWEKYSFFVTNTSNEVLHSPSIVQKGPAKIWYDNFEIKPDPVIKNEIMDGELYLSIESEKSKNIQYKFENRQWQPYYMPVKIEKSGRFIAGIFLNEKQIALTDHYFEIHKALGKIVNYSTNPHPKYFSGGQFGLTDGVRASSDYRDGLWQGIEQEDLDVVIDLGSLMDINEISIGFLQSTGAWIFMPEYVDFYISVDGENFKKVGHVVNTVLQKESMPVIFQYKQKFDKNGVQYVKIFAKNIKNCPAWHQSQGGKAFIFFDEIIIR